MKKHLEKKIRKYVIATLDSPTLYLKKVPGENKYFFVNDVEMATKGMTRLMTNQIMDYYYLDTGENIPLVVIPVEITYEIIEE